MTSVPELRGGLVGCGYFARNHLHAWQEIEGAAIVAVCDRDVRRAEAYADEFGIPASHDDVERLLRSETLDFVDIVTGPETHRPLVEAAARRGVHVICQKPLAPTFADASAMVRACRESDVRFMVHENFRFQRPMRALKDAARRIGDPFFARISFRSGFDVYSRQPYLATGERFILYDLGIHLLDLSRFFLGEPRALWCRARRVNPRIRGEDAATVMIEMQSGATCIVDCSYATRPVQEIFPQTLVSIEGTTGTVSLGADYVIDSVVEDAGEGGTDGARARHSRRSLAEPGHRSWTTPQAAAIQESVVAIGRHWVECHRTGRDAETSGSDNLRTLELLFGAYESASTGEVYEVGRIPRDDEARGLASEEKTSPA